MNIYIIIPAYNEEKVLGKVIEELKKRYSYNIVVVDDASVDDTYVVAQNSGVSVLRHVINRGQGASLRTGTDYALQNGADIIVHFDADGQFDSQDISKMLERILLGDCDIVLGSRFLDGAKTNMPVFRHFFLKIALWVDYFFSGIKLTDVHNGFRVLTAQTASKIEITQDRMAHASEIITEIGKHSLRYKEVPVNIRYTEYSKKKGQSLFNSIYILKDLFLAGLSKK